MSDDLLKEALHALREQGDAPAPAAQLTRARLMRTLHERRRHLVTRKVFWIPIAAILVGGTAAAASGGVPQAYEALARAVGFAKNAPVETAEPAPSEAQVRTRLASESKPSAVEPEPAAVDAGALVPPDEGPGAEPSAVAGADAAARQHRASAPDAGQARPTDDPELLRDHALYQSAHALYFRERDYGRALVAWDAYLEQAPRGALAPEARYNRAMCLLRLGRSREAEAALMPFADGRFGDYRKSEAERLIQAIRAAGAKSE